MIDLPFNKLDMQTKQRDLAKVARRARSDCLQNLCLSRSLTVLLSGCFDHVPAQLPRLPFYSSTMANAENKPHRLRCLSSLRRSPGGIRCMQASALIFAFLPHFTNMQQASTLVDISFSVCGGAVDQVMRAGAIRWGSVWKRPTSWLANDIVRGWTMSGMKQRVAG